MNFKAFFVVLLTLLATRSASSQCTISETDNSLIAIFTKIYMYALAAYQPWDVVFNVNTPIDEATQIYYDVVYNVGIELDIPENEAIDGANDVSMAINETFADMTTCGFGEVYGIAAATFLIDYGNLTNDNAVYTGWLYSNYTRDCMISGDYETNYQCLASGFVQINTAAFLNSGQSFNTLGIYFDDALYEVYNGLTGNSASRKDSKK